MKLLILGGTRFFGKLVLLRCIEESPGYVCFAPPFARKENLNCIQGERELVISELDGKNFDVIIDFSGYDSDKVEATLRHVSTPHYIFISSLWASQFVEKSFIHGKEAYVRKLKETALKNWAHDGERLRYSDSQLSWGRMITQEDLTIWPVELLKIGLLHFMRVIPMSWL